MNFSNKTTILFLVLSSILFGANGDNITTDVTTSGSYQKNGYMNAHTTSFDFTVTISGADQTTYANGEYLPYVIFNSGSATTISGNTSWSVLGATPTTVTFSITDDNIEASTGWPGDGGTVDFQIRFRDASAANSIYDDVTLAGSASVLTIDQDLPYYPLFEPDAGEYTKNSNFYIYTDEATDSLRALWTGDDGSSQAEVISQSINIGYNTITGGITLTEGVTYSLNVQIFDNAHNGYGATHSNIGVDNTNPAITSITSTATAGTYKIGDMIPFKITFNDYVIPSSGSLSATFNTTNDTTVTTGSVAWDQSSSYNKEWSSQYRVQENDNVSTFSVSSVTMTAGTLYDKTNKTSGGILTPNSMSVPVSSFTTNIDDGVAIELDGIRPTITSITTSSVTGSYSIGESINIKVNFSENVSLSSGNLKITLETGDTDNYLEIPAASISSTSTASGTYTVVAGDVSSDLSVKSITLTGGGTLSDAAGNAMTSFTIGTNLSNGIVLETIAPIIGSVTSSASAGTYGIGASIPITVNFINGSGGSAETVTLSTGSLDLTLDTGDDVSNASISSSSTAAFTYTVTEGDASSDLNVSSAAISGGGSLTDAAGNAMSDFAVTSGANLSDNEDIVIEATRPTILKINSTSDDDTYKVGDNINITMQFSEAVTLATSTLDLTFDFEGADQTINIPTFTNSNSTSYTYTVQAGDTTADLTVSNVALATNATLKDVVPNNPNALTNFTPDTTLESQHAIAIDGILPTITKVTSTSADDSYSIGESVNVTVYFYEKVTLSGGNLVITLETGGTDQTVTISSISNAASASGSFTVIADDVSADLSVNSIALSAGSLSDAAGNAMTDFSIPANKNIDDFKDIIIDGTVPAAFTTGVVTTVASISTFVVSGYWNENNTDADVTVPIANDNSLVGGTVQVQAKIDANSYVDVGAAETIQSSDVTNGTLDVRIDQSGSGNTDIEELTSFANGGVITFNAIITDLAGNSTTGTASSTTLTIDTTAATVTNVTSTTNDGIYNTGDDIAVDLTFSDAVTLTGGSLDITMESGSTDNSVSITTITSSTAETATYTVQIGDENSDLYVKTLAVSGGYLIDVAGNPMSTGDLTIASGANISDSKAIEIDGIDPTDFTVGSVTTSGGNVYAGYWNSSNTSITVVVPLDDSDTSLDGGTIQLSAEADGTFEDLGSLASISSANRISGSQTISVLSTETGSTTGLIELTGFNDDDVITITAIITDEAGNSTTGTESSTTLTVDETPPSSFTADTVYSNGNAVAANYYNGVNTGISVKIPLDGTDNTLTGGKIRLQAKAGANSWVSVADFNTILGSDFTAGFKIVSVDSGGTDSTDIHELTGFAENENLYFRAILWDVAGNPRTGNQSTANMVVDQTQPTISSVSSSSTDGSYKSGTTINVDVTATETVNVTGTPKIQLETGTADATVDYSSGTATTKITFQYTVDDGHTSSDLEVRNANALTLNSGTIRDDAGNDLVLTLPLALSGNSLSDNQDIVVDTEDPTAVITFSDSLVKENDVVIVTATFSEQMTSSPQVAILYAGSTELDTTNMSQVSSTVWSKTVTIPDGNDGAATVSIIATDIATNSLTNTNTTNRTLMRVDNTHPTFTLLSPDSGEYVNDALVGYKLSETSFSGAVTWTRTGGAADSNSPHSATLAAAELDAATTFSDYTLTNIPTTLVSGTNYQITWSATDSAGNVSADFISEPVFYDTTAPTASLTYSKYIASVDTVVTITATFNERSLPTPQIAIDYIGGTDDISATNMTIGTDSTIWTYEATIPSGEGNNGIASMSITATDLAGNSLRAADLTNSDTLVVDNTLPTAVITYSDSLVKETDNVTVTLTFSEEMTSSPQIAVDYTGTGSDVDTTNMSNVNDTVWTKSIIIPDGNDGAAVVSVIAEDLAGNSLTNLNTTNRTLMRVDNSHPTFTLLSPDSGEYVNDALVGYKLSETSFSGTVTWTRTGGTADSNSPHSATLAAAELDAATTFSDYTLTNIPTTLVSGTNYQITWSATDSAGNVSADFISEPVFYDTTAPTASLTYSKYIASVDTVVTITATFNERSLPTPQIAIDYIGGTDDISATNMTIGTDSTIWTYEATIPSGEGNNGIASMSITATDLAGNSLRAADLTNSDTLVVDNTLPTAVITYSDSLVKETDNVTVTLTFSEEMTSSPQIAVDYTGTGSDVDTTNMSNVNDTVWTKSIIIPDGNDGAAVVSVIAEDLAGNSLTNLNTTNRTLMRVDNTHPTFTLLSPDSGEYVNDALVGYKLSETSFSGTVTWTRTGGTADSNSPHSATLTATELDSTTTFSAYTLTNIPTTLVSGTNYQITWSATDSAGNVSADFISEPVFYDTTAPTTVLTYSQYIVSADTVVTITAQFDERVVSTPQIAIDYQGVGDDVSTTNMTIGADSTIWTYDATIPSGEGNNDTASVSITATDLADNTLRPNDVANSDTLVVDNTVPTITLSYSNLTQPNLTDEGKYQDIIEITAQFTEKANTVSPPVLNIEYADSTDDSFVALSAFSSSNNDTVWVFRATLPDSSKNDGVFTATLTAKDIAGNPVSTFTNNQVFVLDNTPPDSFATKAVFPKGQNQVTGWYNSTTDSIEISAPIPVPGDDNTILDGGSVDIQVYNIVRGADWVTIPSSDSLTGSGDSLLFYRTKAEIESLLIPETSLIQGDTLIFRAAITDRVGNITYGDTSLSRITYDPFPPNIGVIDGGIFFTKDTVISSDSISTTWTSFDDSVYQLIDGSGLSRYEYIIRHFDSSGVYVDSLAAWSFTEGTGPLASTSFSHKDLALQHQHQYKALIRAYDVAGNISTIVSTDTIRRINSAPIITAITDTIQSFEDEPFTQLIAFADVDTATLLGDDFTYNLTTTHQYAHIPAVPAVIPADTNVVSWTPTQSDTGLYTFQVIIKDNWNFADTVSYSFFVNAVNDTPSIAILTPDDIQTMIEDQTAVKKFLLSTYGNDVDNDSTQLTWQAAILDTTKKPGFPPASLFFGNGTPDIVRQRLLDQYQTKQHYKILNPLIENKESQPEIKLIDPFNIQSKNSLASYIQVDFTDTNGVWWATFNVDSNYYGSDHRIIFYVSDPDGATSQDTVLLTITPQNDPPVIDSIPRFEVTENQFLKLDFADYISDVDDTTLTLRISAVTYHDKMALMSTNSNATTIGDSVQYSMTAFGDTVVFTPQIEWSDTSLIQLIAIDRQNARTSKTFVVDVIRVPRPNLSLEVIQNNAFTNYFEVIVTDTVSKTDSLHLTVQGQPIVLDTIAAFTYVGHYSFDNSGLYAFTAKAWGVVGDTTIVKSVFMAQAKAYQDWTGYSPDGNFRVYGTSGAVHYDQGLLIVDSTMFNDQFIDRAPYRLGRESKHFELPVEVSFSSMSDALAIYQRNGVEWKELPSMTQGSEITAYTKGMGYFRLGPKTIFVPGETSLHQNYPNPFNPVTNIIYDVGFNEGPRQKVKVIVYNLLGQHVTTLVNESKDIGRYTARWDGKDQFGIPVSSGIYFVRMMNSSGRIFTKKMMLIR